MWSKRSSWSRTLAWGALALGLGASAGNAADLPDAKTLLADVGFSADQIAQVEAGSFVPATLQASDPREIVAAFAFLAPTSPSDLVSQLRQGLLDRVDPNTIAFGTIAGEPGLASFAKLTLQPDADGRARTYLAASPGGDLNLSAAELAALSALGSGATTAEVEAAIRSALLGRLQAYRSQGLAGIAPYAREDGATRSPADDLRSATLATRRLQSLVPAAFQALLDYPNANPPGMQEAFRWSQYQAHGVPTLALTHTAYVPDGAAWVVAQRQFYVSGGYNCEQAISGLLPMQQGTLVLYTNRTSTDQVTGFGGSAKRAIGSKLLESQLEELYGKVRAAR